jgi:hypothetical protein
MIGRRQALAVLGVALVGSQAGHLLTFQLIFGSAAQHLQSSGAHAYFPLLAKTALGASAALFLAGLFVIGLARVLTSRSQAPPDRQHAVIELLAALFTIQLACFIAQEVGEGLVAGTGVASAPYLLMWGTLGQLPVAAIAAIALRWLWTRFESAIEDLRALRRSRRPPRALVFRSPHLWPAQDGGLRLSQLAGTLAQRGPPTS